MIYHVILKMAAPIKGMRTFFKFSNMWSYMIDPTRPLSIMVILFCIDFLISVCVIRYVPCELNNINMFFIPLGY